MWPDAVKVKADAVEPKLPSQSHVTPSLTTHTDPLPPP